MVNEFKNTSIPWQSTVPQQMPWMSPYNVAASGLQFGQQLPGDVPNVYPAIHQINHSVHEAPNLEPNIFGHVQALATPHYQTLQATAPNIAFVNPQTNLSSSNTPNFSNIVQGANLHDYIQQSPLTYMPNTAASTSSLTTGSTCQPQKRTSVEMDEETIAAPEPPTKQLLSETKLFKQFGSLQLNQESLMAGQNSSSDSDDSDEDTKSRSTLSPSQGQSRDDLNRYVYLLFKDRNHQGSRPFASSNGALDRLAREERDKLNKAVVLWTPRPKLNFGQQDETEDNSSSDEELTYNDHTDFLKKPANQALTITEIFDSPPHDQAVQDEMMLD